MSDRKDHGVLYGQQPDIATHAGIDPETLRKWLREALDAGERSGASTPFDFDAFLARKQAEALPGR